MAICEVFVLLKKEVECVEKWDLDVMLWLCLCCLLKDVNLWVYKNKKCD